MNVLVEAVEQDLGVFVELIEHTLEDAVGGAVGVIGTAAEAGGGGEEHYFLAGGGAAL